MTTRDEDDLPDDREPVIWARLLAPVILLVVAVGVLVAFGTWLRCQFRADPRRLS